jgi:hypothetical protein
MKFLSKIKATAPGVIHRVFPTLMLLGMLLAVTACNKDIGLPPEEEEEEGEKRAIGFELETAGTKALPTTEVKKIGVFGYSEVTPFVPNYFLNQAVIKPASTWTYSGVVKYWPTDGTKLSFYAYAPYIDVENTFDLKPKTVTAGAPTIEYTVPDDITEQIDLMWSNATNQEYALNNGVVKFTMEHALTKVNFALALAPAEEGRPFMVTINELTIRNVIGKGTLNLDRVKTDGDLWSLASAKVSYDYFPTTGLIDLTLDAQDPASITAYTPLFADGHSLMLIPQSLGISDSTQPEVEINYSYTNTYSGETFPKKATLKLETASLTKWEAGAGVNYQITISVLNGTDTDIKFDIVSLIVYTPWEDVNSGTSTSIKGDVN